MAARAAMGLGPTPGSHDCRPGSRRQQPVEEVAVAAQGQSQVFGGSLVGGEALLEAVAVPAELELSLFDSSPAPGPAPVAAPARRTRAVATDRRTRAPVPAAASGKQRVARMKPAKGRKASRGKAA